MYVLVELIIEVSCSGIDFKKRCNVLKRSNVMKCKKPNENFQNYVIKFLWEVIYAHFYN